MIKQIRESKEYRYDNFKITIEHLNGHLDRITIMGDHSVDYYTFNNFEEAEQIFNQLKEVKEELDG